MAQYKVIQDFTDSNEKSADANGDLHVYRAGDAYPFQPYAGAQTADRIALLTTYDGPNDDFDGPVIEQLTD